MIKFSKDVCEYLRLPDIPKKQWDGKTSFNNGVGVVETISGEQCYVVVSFDAEKDAEPRIVKVFGYDLIGKLSSIFVVPSYMENDDVEDMDLDEESKKRADELAKEAEEIEHEGVEEQIQTPENEYYFDNISNDEEARAFIEAYNKQNKIKGTVPRKHETIVARLGVIWVEQNQNRK